MQSLLKNVLICCELNQAPAKRRSSEFRWVEGCCDSEEQMYSGSGTFGSVTNSLYMLTRNDMRLTERRTDILHTFL